MASVNDREHVVMRSYRFSRAMAEKLARASRALGIHEAVFVRSILFEWFAKNEGVNTSAPIAPEYLAKGLYPNDGISGVRDLPHPNAGRKPAHMAAVREVGAPPSVGNGRPQPKVYGA